MNASGDTITYDFGQTTGTSKTGKPLLAFRYFQKWTSADSISHHILMNPNLLDMFLAEECDSYTRNKLLDTIREGKTSGIAVTREYTFNRFNVILDFEKTEVKLEDDLTVGPGGDWKLDMEEFEKALHEHK